MKKIILLIVSGLVLLSGCNSKKELQSNQFTIKDDLGTSFTFTKAPNRIISLAPNITEMIFTLGLEKHLVGNTLYCYYPEEAKKIEKVGDMLSFNFEKILTLKPDLIFITVEGNTKETYDKFKQLGLKIFVSNPRNYEGIKKTYMDLGKIFNKEKLTNNSIASWDSTVTKIKNESSNFNRSGMYVVELNPLFLVGKSTFMNEYLQFCGIKNIASDSPLNYPIFNREEILRRNPDYIIYPTNGSDNVEKIIGAYPEWKSINAIKNRNVIFVDRDLYSRPGPRFVEALKDLFNRIHHQE